MAKWYNLHSSWQARRLYAPAHICTARQQHLLPRHKITLSSTLLDSCNTRAKRNPSPFINLNTLMQKRGDVYPPRWGTKSAFQISGRHSLTLTLEVLARIRP